MVGIYLEQTQLRDGQHLETQCVASFFLEWEFRQGQCPQPGPHRFSSSVIKQIDDDLRSLTINTD